MSQSQIVPVKLADNEKNRKNEDTQKKNLQKLGYISRLHQAKYVYSKGYPHN